MLGLASDYTVASLTAPSGYDCTYAYNLNSAPVAITRRGDDGGRRNVLVDDLALTYEGNRLVNVSDSGEEVLLEASGDFVDGATGSGEEYAYDANGNMVRDDNRGIRKIVYNCINQPSDIVVGKYENQKMHYDYAADGRKLATYASETLKKIIRDPVDPIIPEVPINKAVISDSLLADPVPGQIILPAKFSPIKLRREYVDNMEYVDGKLSRINTPYGYYNAADSLFYAYQTDRQGNIRVVYTARDNENWQEVWDDNPDDNPKVFYDVVQSTSYYPYGMPIAHGTGAGKNPYKFGGKEYETRFGLNLYDFVARGYDPALGIFLRPDPKAGKKPFVMPYLYCLANPMAFYDPDGEDEVWINKEDGHYVGEMSNSKKNILYVTSSGHKDRNMPHYDLGNVKLKKPGVRIYGQDKDGNELRFQTFTIDNDEAALGAFEFLARNTKFEWSVAICEGEDFVITSCSKNSESGMVKKMVERSRSNKRNNGVYGVFHSHPKNIAIPSEAKKEWNNDLGEYILTGDLGFAQVMKARFPDARLAIFIPRTGIYIPFGVNSKMEYYDMPLNEDNWMAALMRFIIAVASH